ncbi:YkgJ family cysteine cluster protein [Granulicella sp. dw_53]|uniref:YkgJ family cysteine cluster protein n=1 Tax=Granulicella sp. dw_53 TaxID=2719792 RepID=UPI0031F69550
MPHLRDSILFAKVGIARQRDLCEATMPQTLIQIVDAALASAAARSGPHLVCKPGCYQCCVGVFPIALEDAARLREGLEALQQTDLERSQRIQTRVQESLTRLDPWFPGDLATGILHEDYEAAILFEEFANDEPCPVLDPATGTCDLYSTRPILCRTFGPPMRTEEDNLATCELCYIHATTEEIAACELDPTIPAQETASNEAFNATHNLHGETLIAYALRPKQK